MRGYAVAQIEASAAIQDTPHITKGGRVVPKAFAVKRILLLSAAFLVTYAASAYKPAEERDFRDIAAGGCSNRDGDFIVRGMVSSATEDTVVLSDPADAESTLSLTLPGRGPLSRVKGFFTKGKYETAQQRLDELRAEQTPVVVTLKCHGNGTPAARNISYTNEAGLSESITF